MPKVRDINGNLVEIPDSEIAAIGRKPGAPILPTGEDLLKERGESAKQDQTLQGPSYAIPPAQPVGGMGAYSQFSLQPNKVFLDTVQNRMMDQQNKQDTKAMAMADMARRSGQGVGSTALTNLRDKFNPYRTGAPDAAIREGTQAAMAAEQANTQREELAFRKREAALERAESARRFALTHQLEKQKFQHTRTMDVGTFRQTADKIKSDLALQIRRQEGVELSEEHARVLANKNYDMAMQVNQLNAQLQDKRLAMDEWVHKVSLMYQGIGVRLDFHKLQEASRQARMGEQLQAQNLILQAANLKQQQDTAYEAARWQREAQQMTQMLAYEQMRMTSKHHKEVMEMQRQSLEAQSAYRNRSLDQSRELAYEGWRRAEASQGREFEHQEKRWAQEDQNKIMDRILSQQQFRSTMDEAREARMQERGLREQEMDARTLQGRERLQAEQYRFDTSQANMLRENLQRRNERTLERELQERQFGQTHSLAKASLAERRRANIAGEGLSREGFGIQREGLGIQREGLDLQRAGLAQSGRQFDATMAFNQGRALVEDAHWAEHEGNVVRQQGVTNEQWQKMFDWNKLTHAENMSWQERLQLYKEQRDKVGDEHWGKQFAQTQQNFERNLAFMVQRGNAEDIRALREFSFLKERAGVTDRQWQQTFDQNKAQFGEEMALKIQDRKDSIIARLESASEDARRWNLTFTREGEELAYQHGRDDVADRRFGEEMAQRERHWEGDLVERMKERESSADYRNRQLGLEGEELGLRREDLGLRRDELGLRRQEFGHRMFVDLETIRLKRKSIDQIAKQFKVTTAQADRAFYTALDQWLIDNDFKVTDSNRNYALRSAELQRQIVSDIDSSYFKGQEIGYKYASLAQKSREASDLHTFHMGSLANEGRNIDINRYRAEQNEIGAEERQWDNYRDLALAGKFGKKARRAVKQRLASEFGSFKNYKRGQKEGGYGWPAG
jgi:hypothetical protein